MTRDVQIETLANGLPNTFVPGRNLMFLTMAAALAYRRGLQVLVGGMCETDFSGYPDCRDDTLKALQVALNLGMNRRFVIETPLMCAAAVAAQIASLWPAGAAHRLVVCTGGEPLLQLNDELIAALHAAQFEIALETNGTLPIPAGIDWICVSPKAAASLLVTQGNELKVVVPQDHQQLLAYEKLDFDHFLVQPMDNAARELNTRFAIDWCKQHPHHRSLCCNLHGHRYVLEITLTGKPIATAGAPDRGMVMDFAQVKALALQHLVEHWDHAFLVYAGDTAVRAFLDTLPNHKTVVLEQIPTVENLAAIAFKA
ncbi:hypothetical protein BGZ97_004070 [Linnemannia gamsii]|uniref:7-carboxy-7-deazaguanine synthase n=1 Tax=Linnemannia gamsii TaxID=64522 RepID=A0A9P6RPV3_9FUNG|nr:hypothetical protein BGZ97_004070 [Linnemannia gamsii]